MPIDVTMLNMQAVQAIRKGDNLKAHSLVGRALRLRPDNPTAQALFSFLKDDIPSPPQFWI